MATEINRIQGTYRVQNVSDTGVVSDLLVVDTTGSGYVVSSVPTNSRVIVTGDLVVVGTRTESSSTVVTFKDPTLLLNQGNSFSLGIEYLGGIKISRDASDTDENAAFIQWNNNAVWHGSGDLSDPAGIPGVFEFRKGLPTSPEPLYGAIKINAIRMPRYTGFQPDGKYSTIPAAGAEYPRLNIFGSDNPTSVLSVFGTSDYENNVTDDDDIPNKKYVDDALASGIKDAENLVQGNSYVTINDKVADSASYSEIIGVLDGVPSTKPNPTTGTVVMRITTSTAQIARMQFNQNQISPVGTNANLVISANGSGQIIAAKPLVFQTSVPPVPSPGQTGIYSTNPGNGGTGMYYVNNNTGGTVTSDEFVSRKRALIFSLIF